MTGSEETKTGEQETGKKAPVKKERQFKVGQTVQSKTNFRMKMQCFEVQIEGDTWFDPQTFITIPKGTTLKVLEVKELAVVVSLEFAEFSIDLDIRKDLIK